MNKKGIHDLNLWIEVYEERHERYSLEVEELNSLRKKIKVLYCGNYKGIGDPIKRIKSKLTFAYRQISNAKDAILELRLKIDELEEKPDE
jgi:predicted nuclease with TOPRIM domain